MGDGPIAASNEKVLELCVDSEESNEIKPVSSVSSEQVDASLGFYLDHEIRSTFQQFEFGES